MRKYSLPLAIAVLFGFLLVEIGSRYLRPRPPGSPTIENYTEPQSRILGLYDSKLGWVPDVYNPDDRPYRITSNRIPFKNNATILAIGGSSTHGLELIGKRTWPARLERNLELKVVNGGARQYGLAQMLLRARQALEWVKPATVIVAIASEDLYFSQLMINRGMGLPYFRIGQNENLELIPPVDRSQDSRGIFRKTFGYSYFVHLVMKKIFRNAWLSGSRDEMVEVPVDPVPVGKKIIDAFQDEIVVRRGIPLVFVFLPGNTNDTMIVKRDDSFPGAFEIGEHIRQIAEKSNRTYLLDLQSRLQSSYPDPEDRARYGGAQSGQYKQEGMAFIAENLAAIFGNNGKPLGRAAQ